MSRLPLVLVASAVAAALISGCGSSSSAAATVSGHDISREDLNRDLRDIRDNKPFTRTVAQQGGSPVTNSKGTVTSSLTAAWLVQLVEMQVVHADFVKRGLKTTAADRQAAQQSAPNAFGSQEIFNAFPKSFRDRYLTGAAEIQALYRAVEGTPTSQTEAQDKQQKFSSYLLSSLKKADVKVDHRYGSARFTAQGFNIVPPTAPNPREKPGTTTTTALNPLGSTPSG
jgi:hypothetical protein